MVTVFLQSLWQAMEGDAPLMDNGMDSLSSLDFRGRISKELIASLVVVAFQWRRFRVPTEPQTQRILPAYYFCIESLSSPSLTIYVCMYIYIFFFFLGGGGRCTVCFVVKNVHKPPPQKRCLFFHVSLFLLLLSHLCLFLP